MTNSRQKGAAFEREIAKQLNLLLGTNLKRDLDQYRERDRGDLICDEPFPFLIECKARVSGGFQNEWWKQAYRAAIGTGQRPCVIYKINNKGIRVRVQIRAIVECLSGGRWSAEDQHICEIDLGGFAYLAREAMNHSLTRAVTGRGTPTKGEKE